MLLAFSTVWQHILVFAGLERIGKGLRTASRDAIISESMPTAKGKGFGIHRAFDTIGAILGSSMVLGLYWYFQFTFKSIILIAAALALLSLIPLAYVKETPGKPRDLSLKISLKGLPQSLKLFVLISGVFSLANFSYMFFILRAQAFFAGKLSIGVPIILYILFNIFYAIFAIPSGKIADKIGRKKVIVSGYFLFSITCLGFAVFHSLIAFIVLFALYGIVYALVDGNQRAYVSDLSEGKLRATALGTFHTVIGLTALPSSLIAGFLFQHVPALTFIFGAAVSFTSVVIFIFVINDRERI